MKKVWKLVGIILAVIVLLLVAYVVYVFAAYHRLPDKLALEVKKIGGEADFKESVLSEKESCSIITYNIGFGAYQPEYSFFMDGGKYSWGKDKESVTEAVLGAGELVRSLNPDFILLQEVDRDGTRSYHIDEMEVLEQSIKGYYYTYAQNYDSPFLFYPLLEPHGANKAGIVSFSRGEITDSIRRSLPISESFSKFVDLDRCYSISRIPLENGKIFCLYNIHMSAYGSSDKIRSAQLAMLYEDMEADYKAGNYVICGGDFNHNMKIEYRENYRKNEPEWAYLFPRETLPEGFRLAIDEADDGDVAHNTCRDASAPYDENTSYTVTLDGFIVSDNVTVNSYRHIDSGYKNSDHDPVFMEFTFENGSAE